MSDYNASDTRQIRRAAKAAKQAEAERRVVIFNLMSSPAGRSYFYDRLVRCHIFSSSFSHSALSIAFAEGERNIGLQDLTDIMAFAPDQYVQMMREANDRSSNADRPDRSGANGRGDDSRSEPEAGSVTSEYDPNDNDGADPGAEG